jgi:tape measure domain-containing protein
MAVELAQAYVSITPSARGIGRSLSRELTGPLTTAGGNAGDAAASSFGRRFTPAMSRIARTSALAFTGAFAAAGLWGINVAADFEQTRIGFEGILGDAAKAEKLLKDLRDFAAKTPFEFTGLADSAKQLLAVGFTTEEILPTMETLGNVAATLGVGEAEIKGVVRALGQMRGKGKASAEELQQISEQIPGFSAITVIAEDMGITTAEAFKLMEKGAIPADDAIESILNGMEEFPGAAGAMDRQSKTLNGVLSTFKDTLSGIAIDFITPYLPAISSAVASFGDMLQGFFSGMQTGFTEGATGAEGFGGRVGDAFRAVRDFIRDELIPRVSAIVSEGFAAVKAWWDENGEALTATATGVFGAISTVIGDVVTVIKDQLLPRFEDFATWLATDGPGMQLAITGIATALGLYAASAIIAAGATLIALWPFLLAAGAIALMAWAFGRLSGEIHLFERIGEVINDFDFILEGVIDTLEDAIGLIEKLIELAKKVPSLGGGDGGLGIPIGPFQIPLAPLLERFDDGGVMGGRRGVHYPAMVAGGETILPTHKSPLAELLGGGGGTAPLVAGDVNLYAGPTEDPDVALLRGLRKVRLLSVA